MNPANSRTIDEYFAAQPGHQFGQPTPELFIAGWRAAEERMRQHADGDAVPGIIRLEAAYNADSNTFIGLRFSAKSGQQVIVTDGIQVGRRFVPGIGERIEYRLVALLVSNEITDQERG